VEGFAELAHRVDDVGLVLCGIAGHMDPGIWPAVQERIARHGISERVLVVEDLSHDAFLEALSRSSVYLRTPVTDGVCSSVLEALALGVPVVAAENHNRPAGVITYPAVDVAAMARTLDDVLLRREEIAAALPRPEIRDTLLEEARLLTGV
jgi:glycosyltransferase involved in cell wall biosynthesis